MTSTSIPTFSSFSDALVALDHGGKHLAPTSGRADEPLFAPVGYVDYQGRRFKINGDTKSSRFRQFVAFLDAGNTPIARQTKRTKGLSDRLRPDGLYIYEVDAPATAHRSGPSAPRRVTKPAAPKVPRVPSRPQPRDQGQPAQSPPATDSNALTPVVASPETTKTPRRRRRRSSKIEESDGNQINGTSIADELVKLAQLRYEGVIDSADWERAKDHFLGKNENGRSRTAQQLRDLHELHRSGALSASEFNLTKWDILSRAK